MIKTMLFVKRKNGLSMEEFIRHYEEVHAPLAVRLIPKLKKYTRNYLSAPNSTEERIGGWQQSAGFSNLGFDCVTEFWWETREDYAESKKAMGTEALQVLPKDEETFMDRDSMFWHSVEEKISDI